MTNGRELLDRYNGCQVTLTFYSKNSGALWKDKPVLDDLQTAAERIIDDAQENAPYSVMVHTSNGDVSLSKNELHSVVDEVRAKRS